MYQVAVSNEFIAMHYLVGGDWGAENHPHSHNYKVEFQISGETLNQHGYLVDIVDIENALEVQVEKFQNKLLNDLPEFAGLNPSIEHFSRILCHAMSEIIQEENALSFRIKLWENEEAWASYQLEL